MSNKVGAALDPCAAMRTTLEFPAGGVTEIVFFLGQAETRRRRARLSNAIAPPISTHVLPKSALWDETLGAIEVKTPDRAMDIMLNGWLLYQTLACRVWARSAFYQASGAYGFRDQLQDGMALVAARPDLTREHLLRAAAGSSSRATSSIGGCRIRARACAREYPMTGPGWPIPSRIMSRPPATSACWTSRSPFLEGPRCSRRDGQLLSADVSETRATLFEHCALALDQSLAVGRHGLPLMGAGDWNDGMNRVGEKGEGESVWLGWFLLCGADGLRADCAERAANRPTAPDSGSMHANALKVRARARGLGRRLVSQGLLSTTARRSARRRSEECRIDSIAQSWAVLSGAAPPARAARAMAALDRELIRRDDGLALLFAPPFDRTPLDPGYIKGYPPGVRENGGQYTHAAAWTVMAFAASGDGDKAAELFAMLNPINHSRTRADAHRYKVEPYVVCRRYLFHAAPCRTRRLDLVHGIGRLVAARRRGEPARAAASWALAHVDPCIPKAWGHFEATMNYSASYHVESTTPAASIGAWSSRPSMASNSPSAPSACG